MRVVRAFSAELKERLVGRAKGGELVQGLSAETGVLRSSLVNGLRRIGRLGLRGSIAGGDGRARLQDRLLDPWRESRGRPTLALPPWVIRMAFRRRKPEWPSLSVWSDVSNSISIFFKQPCGHGTRRSEAASRPSLRGRRKNDARRIARRNGLLETGRGASRTPGWPVAGELLALARTEADAARRYAGARPHPAPNAAQPPRGLPTDHPQAAGRSPRGQRQAGPEAHAGRQPVELAATAIRPADDGEPASLPGRAQPDARARSQRPRPDLGRRHH